MRYDKGPLGALMDEYERAAAEFGALISSVPAQKYDVVLDPNTANEDCRSIQRICYHVLFAGYNYANSIRRKFGTAISSPEKFVPEQEQFLGALDAMLAYTDETLSNRYSMTDEDLNQTMIHIRWSDHHDMEALLEHAVVHILRHRRQVERFLNAVT